jgi:uncharacterized protein YcbX
MKIAEIRRYPVKSMGGESLESVDVDARGLVGDRWFAVVDAAGKLGSGKNSRRFRRLDEIFEYSAAMTDGDTRVAGPSSSWMVGDPELDRVLSQQVAAEVRILSEAGTPHQDAGQVSLVGTASLDWCREHLGVDADRRRLRPNLVVDTHEPFVEETWSGTLAVGSCRLTVVGRIERCRMVDIAQEGLPPEGRWLKALTDTRDMSLGVYLAVTEPGTIRLGDEVHTGG